MRKCCGKFRIARGDSVLVCDWSVSPGASGWFDGGRSIFGVRLSREISIKLAQRFPFISDNWFSFEHLSRGIQNQPWPRNTGHARAEVLFKVIQLENKVVEIIHFFFFLPILLATLRLSQKVTL